MPSVEERLRYWRARATAAEARAEAAEQASAVEASERRRAHERIAALEKALTPSAETKAAYSGEFKFTRLTLVEDDDGEAMECQQEVTVPWDTVKEIMAAIRAYALRTGGGE